MYRPTPAQHPVAVFGSLRDGAGNSGLWTGMPDVRSLGPAALHGVDLVYEHSGFPYALSGELDAAAEVIVAETPEAWADLIGRLDRLEGHPDFYTRTLRTATLATGEEITVWTYLNDHLADQLIGANPVIGNDWSNHDHRIIDGRVVVR